MKLPPFEGGLTDFVDRTGQRNRSVSPVPKKMHFLFKECFHKTYVKNYFTNEIQKFGCKIFIFAGLFEKDRFRECSTLVFGPSPVSQ